MVSETISAISGSSWPSGAFWPCEEFGKRAPEGRVLAPKDGARVWLVSRTGRDHAGRFPQIAETIRRLPASLILDGEIARFAKRLVSRFHLLHENTHGELAAPPVFVVFDCVWRRGRDLRGTLTDRRRALEREIGDGSRT